MSPIPTPAAASATKTSCSSSRLTSATVITTLLFDLDDTLLANDMDRFLPAYFQQVSEHFAGWRGVDRLIPELVMATRAAVANTDPSRTLLSVFSECFSEALG